MTHSVSEICINSDMFRVLELGLPDAFPLSPPPPSQVSAISYFSHHPLYKHLFHADTGADPNPAPVRPTQNRVIHWIGLSLEEG